MVQAGELARGWLNIGLTVMLLVCVAVIVGTAAMRWIAGPYAKPAGIEEGPAGGSV
jgi:carbon starvation protein